MTSPGGNWMSLKWEEVNSVVVNEKKFWGQNCFTDILRLLWKLSWNKMFYPLTQYVFLYLLWIIEANDKKYS